MRVEWCGEEFELLHEGALLRVRDRALIIADLHFGKAATFRTAGVPVPGGTTLAQLGKLNTALHRAGAATLYILGDLLHSAHGRSKDMIDAFTEWRCNNSALPITLIRGNHDRAAGDPPEQWRINCVDEPFRQSGLYLCHHPDTAPQDAPSIAGHVHPAVRIENKRLSSARVKSFLISDTQILLPAFGTFTGSCIVEPQPGDKTYGILEGEVIELTRLLEHRPVG